METFLEHLASGNSGAAERAKALEGLEAQYEYVKEHIINYMYR